MPEKTEIELLHASLLTLVDIASELNEETHELREAIDKLIELIKGLAQEAEEDDPED